ncbi:MAG: metallophosphoesterase, partial [Sodaliphilus sp.]|nr:metallophosphoesterase [Sodaliphilus sp.]
VLAQQTADEPIRLAMWLLLVFYGIQAPKFISLLIYSLSWLKWLRRGAKRFVRCAAVAIFVLLIFHGVWGTFVTPFTLEVKHVTIESPRLPDAFDGYRIVQFSDSHVGTYGTDTAFVSEYVDSINAQGADMICFTGDLVNRHSKEVEPFVSVLSRLHAPDGVISVLGNHDYKAYFPWASEQEWRADSLNLLEKQRQMGWTVCDDSTFTRHRGADSIVVVGLHSFRPPHWKIPAYLREVYPQIANPHIYKIVLQHVPYVWDNYTDTAHIDLMLSGHTHAMQLMFSFFGVEISPARLISPYWRGEYHNGDESLYVNTGVGEVGVPMRIGVKPEITVITLKKKK